MSSVSAVSDDDDEDFNLYTNVAKNMKDFKQSYMLGLQTPICAKELASEPAISLIGEPSVSPPKQQKTSLESPVVLSDDDDPVSVVSTRPLRSNSNRRGKGRQAAANRGRGRGCVGKNTTATDLSIQLLSNPSQLKNPRTPCNWAVDDFSFDDSNVEEEDDNYEMNVKVRWKSDKIIRFPIRRYQKLSSIFEHFSKMENIPQSQILMTLQDNIISVDDTPDSIKLTIANFIEGGIMTESSVGTSKVVPAQVEKDSIELKVRTKESKSSKMIVMQKTQKMLILMTKYSELAEIPMNKLKFSFDGDALDPNDTPADLDLEGGEMIDLVVLP